MSEDATSSQSPGAPAAPAPPDAPDAPGGPGEPAVLGEPAAELPRQPLVLYDGQCGLCNRSVRWLIEHDGGQLRYAPLQGPTAAAARARFPHIPETLESVVLVDGDRAHLRSKAFLHLARYLRWPWRAGRLFTWLPAALLDPLYRFIARNRYRWFGHYDECRLPTQRERQRLLP